MEKRNSQYEQGPPMEQTREVSFARANQLGLAVNRDTIATSSE